MSLSDGCFGWLTASSATASRKHLLLAEWLMGNVGTRFCQRIWGIEKKISAALNLVCV